MSFPSLITPFSRSQGQEWGLVVDSRVGFLPDQEISDSVCGFSIVTESRDHYVSHLGQGGVRVYRATGRWQGGRKEADRRKSKYQEMGC